MTTIKYLTLHLELFRQTAEKISIEHTSFADLITTRSWNPFVELKGSLNTFLNAMTYSYKTMYPLASNKMIRIFNLMSVYMDGAFHPNITKERKILEQEGWHYEMIIRMVSLRVQRKAV